MDVKTILIFQLIADILLCIAFLFLLLRIGRNIQRHGIAAADDRYLSEFKKLLQDSQEDKCGTMGRAIYKISSEKRHDQIMKLLETGLTAEQIAGCTGLTIGEVMLFVDLEKKIQIADF